MRTALNWHQEVFWAKKRVIGHGGRDGRPCRHLTFLFLVNFNHPQGSGLDFSHYHQECVLHWSVE